MLVLSLFPGIGLLDRAFEAEGICIVRGPDALWGGDIRAFCPPAGRFDGIIAGSPCQDFSSARRCEPTGNGLEMLTQFQRVVIEAQPDWWLLENVPGVPDVRIPGYNWQRLDLRAAEFGLVQRRLRHIQFGSRYGNVLVIDRHQLVVETEPTVMASDTTTPWDKFCSLQGLPGNFDIPAFTVGAKREAVGNGVPLPMGRALAQAVRAQLPASSVNLCACSCGRPVVGNQIYAGGACRMRALRRRQSES
ncbi:MAG: DNA cytosine methyltransferase [Anaerolinea sp.]|nr:DNA cytosine methyltransferase [Anaerolinea sp.]